MPSRTMSKYRYKPKYGYGSKQYKRRNTKKPFKATISKSLQTSAIPDRFFTKLRYSSATTLTSTLGLPSIWQFRGNSIADPDLTFTGHQPLAHDELAALYQNYRVHGCKIVVTASNQTSVVSGFIVLNANRNTTAPTVINTEAERARSIKRVVSGGTGMDKTVLKMYNKSKAVLGLKSLGESISHQASFGSNPAIPWVYNITYATNDATNTSVVDINVQLTYFVECFNRKLLSES